MNLARQPFGMTLPWPSPSSRVCSPIRRKQVNCALSNRLADRVHVALPQAVTNGTGFFTSRVFFYARQQKTSRLFLSLIAARISVATLSRVQHAISKATHHPRSFNMERLLFAAALAATTCPALRATAVLPSTSASPAFMGGSTSAAIPSHTHDRNR